MPPTLEELEGVRWGEPEYGSHVVRTCHRLRKKPIEAFSVEDFRIMTGQGFSLEHLAEPALAIVEKDPLAEGDFFPGDLACALARPVNDAYWEAHVAQRRRLVEAVQTALQRSLALEADGDFGLGRDAIKELEAFLARMGGV